MRLVVNINFNKNLNLTAWPTFVNVHTIITGIDIMAEKKSKNFEQKMTEIEKIVINLEQKDLELEQSLELFEKGTALIRECQKTLSTVEQKISTLTAEPQ